MVIRPSFLAAIGLALLAPPAFATWSIVACNRDTGEVGVGSATCLNNFNLESRAGVIVVGRGAAQVQSRIDTTAQNRQIIFNGLQSDLTAPEILAIIQNTVSGFEAHQYGIADIQGHAATYSGALTAPWTGGVGGQAGSISYAIQGNVLTCASVVLAAEQALIDTPGDLGQKLMAAMQAARSYGGDGRCSCSSQNPPGCGCPRHFTVSAHVGYVVIARIGDTDGVCNAQAGCVNGSYYMNINITGPSTDDDPVASIQRQFDTFRAGWAGHADAIRSQKSVVRSPILADGQSEASIEIALVDIDGSPIATGGAVVSVSHDESSARVTTIGTPTDRGNGTYSVPIQAGFDTGTDVFRVVVEDGHGPVTLYPFPTLAVVSPLSRRPDSISSQRGNPVHLLLKGDAASAGRSYVVLGTASGTIPGTRIRGVPVPINPDSFTLFLIDRLRTPVFRGGAGFLDEHAEADATFNPRRNELFPYVGGQLEFVWITRGPVDYASNAVSVQVTP